MKRRGPRRIDRRPTRGDRTNITTEIGTGASPDLSAEYPASCCTKRTRKNVSVDSPAYTVRVSTFANVKLRRANRASGRMGLSVRVSHHKNAAKSVMPATSGTRIAGEPHP